MPLQFYACLFWKVFANRIIFQRRGSQNNYVLAFGQIKKTRDKRLKARKLFLSIGHFNFILVLRTGFPVIGTKRALSVEKIL
jgi:hypothetical protein